PRAGASVAGSSDRCPSLRGLRQPRRLPLLHHAPLREIDALLQLSDASAQVRLELRVFLANGIEELAEVRRSSPPRPEPEPKAGHPGPRQEQECDNSLDEYDVGWTHSLLPSWARLGIDLRPL